MYIIVSNDSRIPPDLLEQGVQVEQWTLEEFIRRASSDDGLEIDSGLYYDVSVLNKEIYDCLYPYKEYEINGKIIFYYRFDDMPMPTGFPFNEDVTIYSTKQPEPEYEPEPEIEPEPEPTSVIEEVPPVVEDDSPLPTPDPVSTAPVSQPTYQPPVQPQPVYAQPAQPVYQQPAYNQPAQQPVYTQPVPPQPVQQPVYQQPAYSQPAYQQSQSSISLAKDDYDEYEEKPVSKRSTESKKSDNNKKKDVANDKILRLNIDNMLLHDDFDVDVSKRKKKKAPARVILFGSSKGGTGKTFTCLISAYWYAKTHPNEKIALADFDIIDGQIGITINKLTPTMQDFYKLHRAGRKDFQYLENCKIKSEHFSPNIDFYLAPSQDIPQITNDVEFWNELFQTLITNYDVVFFDSGIDYLGKPPISQLYKIADKIIITTNPSINSTKSVIKQFKTLSGQRVNSVFRPGDDILSRVRVVLTRVYDNTTINDIVIKNLQTFAPVIAKFGNIDKIISEVQWYQHWNLIDENPKIYEQLEKIIEIEDDEED